MRRSRMSACIAFFFSSTLVSAEPTLQETTFYKDKAKGCQVTDRIRWPQPIVGAFESAKADLMKMELCKNSGYSIFTMAFRLDPDGPNDQYYRRIYHEIAFANGYRSYAIVDPNWGRVTEVDVKGKESISVSYEDFAVHSQE